MGKVDRYRVELRGLADWKPFLLAESGLPGPRGNLELADAVAEEGNEALFRTYSAVDADQAPANTPGEFLAVCGMVGLGRLLAEGQRELLPLLRAGASDRRWRIREAVAIEPATPGQTGYGGPAGHRRGVEPGQPAGKTSGRSRNL